MMTEKSIHLPSHMGSVLQDSLQYEKVHRISLEFGMISKDLDSQLSYSGPRECKAIEGQRASPLHFLDSRGL